MVNIKPPKAIYGNQKMNRKSIVLLLACFVFPATCVSQTYYKSNGIYSYSANQFGYPMISNLYVGGTLVMPFDNAGAGFQMTSRSSSGNAYNPTQAGDCAQNPSQIVAINPNWTGSGLGISPSNGLLFSVVPRNYNEPTTCLGAGSILPYSFEFGATMGDGIVLPKEVMVIDMYYQRWTGAQSIEKGISEAPTIFPSLSIFPLAFWSATGTNYQPFYVNGSNDMRTWPTGINQYRTGKMIMACTTALTNCLAFYSNKSTNLVMSRRQGASNQLSLLTLTADTGGSITDFNQHHVRTLMLVGKPSTVLAGINQSLAAISQWGNL